MLYLKYARLRLKSCLREIESISHSEFPYDDSYNALKLLEKFFQSLLDGLNDFDSKSNPDVVRQSCARSLDNIVHYLPLLGFLLRSTNVRNGFEVCHPLLRLCRKILADSDSKKGLGTHLVLSSEWDFSPYIYTSIPELPGFVFIGLPATESANPLILPLAGHEIGHSLWRTKRLGAEFGPITLEIILATIQKNIGEFNSLTSLSATPENLSGDIFILKEWERGLQWLKRQAEETFCDFIGIRLFGTAYLYSFAYLASPTWGNGRSYFYPEQKTRIQNMLLAAESYSVEVPELYEDQFDKLPPPEGTRVDQFLLRMADESLVTIVTDLIHLADSLIDQKVITLPSESGTQKALQYFNKIIPAENSSSLADILNAAWLAFINDNLWKDNSNILTRRENILTELLLKTIEIYDIEQTFREKHDI